MILYRIARVAVFGYAKIVHGLRIYGRDRVPKAGGFVLACNHVKALDPVIVAVCLKRPMRFMAKQELFDSSKFAAGFLKLFGAFPVKRGKGDSQALDTAVSLVQDGEIVSIFPEGTRVRDNGEQHRPKSGVAVIALRAEAGVLPCAIRYEKKRIRTLARFYIGHMIPADELHGDDTSEIKESARRIMDTINALPQSV